MDYSTISYGTFLIFLFVVSYFVVAREKKIENCATAAHKKYEIFLRDPIWSLAWSWFFIAFVPLTLAPIWLGEKVEATPVGSVKHFTQQHKGLTVGFFRGDFRYQDANGVLSYLPVEISEGYVAKNDMSRPQIIKINRGWSTSYIIEKDLIDHTQQTIWTSIFLAMLPLCMAVLRKMLQPRSIS